MPRTSTRAGLGLLALLAALASIASGETPEHRPGVPTRAAALFATTDEAFHQGDVERLASHYAEDFVGLPLGLGKRVKIARLARLIQRSPSRVVTIILGGGTLGDRVLLSVDHHLEFETGPRQVHKVYFLEPAEEGYRIVASVETVGEGERYRVGGAEPILPHIGLRLAPPEGWISFRTATGGYLEERFFLSPELDAWISTGLVDTGGHDARTTATRETELLSAMVPGLEVVQERAVRHGGLPGWRTVFRFPRPGEEEGRLAERVHLVRGELAQVFWCRARRSAPPGVCDAALGPVLGSVREENQPPDAMERFLAMHGHGRFHGNRFESHEPPVAFTAPRGWKGRGRGSGLPYLVGMRSPSEERELLAGALPLSGEPEPTVRSLVRLAPAETGGGLEEVEVAGVAGWKATQRFGLTENRVVFVPQGDVLHFFSIRPAGPETDEVLERFLRGVRFEVP